MPPLAYLQRADAHRAEVTNATISPYAVVLLAAMQGTGSSELRNTLDASLTQTAISTLHRARTGSERIGACGPAAPLVLLEFEIEPIEV